MYENSCIADWPEVSVYDLARWKNGLAFKNIQFTETGDPVIKIAELKNGITHQTKFTSEEYAHDVRIVTGDMLFSWSGNPDTSIDVFRWDNRPGWLNQHIFKVTPRDDVDEEYLFFLLKSLILRFAEIARNKQTTGLGHVTLADLRRMRVGLPSKLEQEKIVAILGPIHNKIDLNRRMNETLESMARALFKSWFVNFDPIRAKMEGRQPAHMDTDTAAFFPTAFDASDFPKGWSERPVYNIGNFVNGAAYKNMYFCARSDGLPVIKIAELKSGITAQTKFTNTNLGEKYRIDTGEVLFSWSGNPDTSIDVFIWDGGPAWLNQHIFAVRENGEASKAFAFFQLKQLMPTFAEIARNKQTTGLGHVTVRDMKELMVCNPPTKVADAFEAIANPLFEKIFGNMLENRNLAKLRDTLLPKLISGEIRVSDAEQAAGEAT